VSEVEQQPITILVVDDQALVRNGFAAILSTEPGLRVVGEAADGLEAIEQVHRLDPDVVLMDIRMPVLDGVEATRRLVAQTDTERPRVLMLTTFDDDQLVQAALRVGATGFLLKDARPEELIEGIRTVHRGDALLAPKVLRRLIDSFTSSDPTGAVADSGSDGASGNSPSERSRHAAPASPTAAEAEAGAKVARLTERERSVLVHMAHGLSNLEIAGEMFVAETTVKTHVGRIFAKLEARDRTQAVIVAYEAGLMKA
jgi:DNA-binding NarL/FixJ family response regulator